MSRTYFIEHDGTKILYLDFTEIRDKKEALGAVSEAKTFVAKQEHASLLTLTNFTGSTYDLDVARALWDLASHNKPYVKAGAVVGVEGLKEDILNLVTRMSRRVLPTFATVDEAKDWLATQQKEE